MSVGFRRSFLRCLIVIVVCVVLNLVGVFLSHEADSILFLDLVGTAIASLVYGPMHGALVGFLTNGIGEHWFKYYFLFAPVQAVCAATWGTLPRLLRGRAFTDFFNDGTDPITAAGTRRYGYAHILLGLLGVSFISNLLASLTIGIIVATYTGHISCVAAVDHLKAAMAAAHFQQPPNDPSVLLCDIAKLLYHESDYDFSGAWWKVAAAKALLGWPDQLIAFAVAVLMVAYTMPRRRYRMSGPFGATMVTQRWQVALCFAGMFILLSLYRIYFAVQLSDSATVFWDLFLQVIYLNFMLLIFISSTFEFDRFETDLDQKLNTYVFPRVNGDLDRAFEDSLKLMAVISVVIIWFIKWRCGNCIMNSPLLSADGKDKVTGFLGVVFVIGFAQYLSLITARVSRSFTT